MDAYLYRIAADDSRAASASSTTKWVYSVGVRWRGPIRLVFLSLHRHLHHTQREKMRAITLLQSLAAGFRGFASHAGRAGEASALVTLIHLCMFEVDRWLK